MSGNNPDYEPPMACVSRVMKQSLPDNVLLTKDARAAFVRAAGIFIFYLTHCANDFCRESGRTTIFPQDIMAALKELHFEDFERPLEEFLEAYKKELELNKKQPKPKAAKADAGAAMDEEVEDGEGGEGEGGEGGEAETEAGDEAEESQDHMKQED